MWRTIIAGGQTSSTGDKTSESHVRQRVRPQHERRQENQEELPV